MSEDVAYYRMQYTACPRCCEEQMGIWWSSDGSLTVFCHWCQAGGKG